jgi:hypothetical protein
VDLDDPAFATPEEAALAGWEAVSQARVLASRVTGDFALVVVDTVPSHQMLVQCERSAEGWRWFADQGWDRDELPPPGEFESEYPDLC